MKDLFAIQRAVLIAQNCRFGDLGRAKDEAGRISNYLGVCTSCGLQFVAYSGPEEPGFEPTGYMPLDIDGQGLQLFKCARIGAVLWQIDEFLKTDPEANKI